MCGYVSVCVEGGVGLGRRGLIGWVCECVGGGVEGADWVGM